LFLQVLPANAKISTFKIQMGLARLATILAKPAVL
jgi:hypothetical protein